jgi:hypothetical protein
MFDAFGSREFTKTWKAAFALCCLWSAFCCAIPSAPGANNAASSSLDAPISEYQVKALYLYNFTKFVEWPANSFNTRTSPIIIGIIGDESFGNLVEEVTKNKTIQERSIVVRRLKWSEDILSCHMLFIGAYDNKRMDQFSDILQSAPILTITEIDEASKNKGIMNLFIDGGKVQFEANLTAAEKAQLRISSKLLRMAKAVTGKIQGKKE